MNSIPHVKRYLPHELVTRIHAVECYPPRRCFFYLQAIQDFSSLPYALEQKVWRDKRILDGSEFTHVRKTKRVHPMDELCQTLHVEHKCIRPRTPWHNGKVERSHRNDQERFYNLLSFTSFEELQREMADYLKRSNQIPSKAIGWMSPIEKRKQLFEKQPPLTAPDLPKDIMNFLYENGT